MKSFKKTSNFDRRDSGRSGEQRFKKFGGKSSSKFTGDSERLNKNFGGRSRSSGSRLKLYDAVCAKCGNNCEVPFEPTGNKPVYCRNCFRENNSGSSNESFSKFRPKERFDDPFSNDKFERKSESKEYDASTALLEKINKKLDKIMKVLKIE